MNISKSRAIEIIDSFRPNHLWKKNKNKWYRLQELEELS